jgi:hypothetical protein
LTATNSLHWGGGAGDSFLPVDRINARWTSISDADLYRIDLLDRLRILDLQHTQLTDASLAYLGRLKYLETLRISDTMIVGKRFDRLQTCSRLRVLEFGNQDVSFDSYSIFSSLSRLPNLQELTLIATGPDLIGIEAVKQLTHLTVRGRAFTGDNSLVAISQLPNLIFLDLSRTSVTDENVRVLAKSPSLIHLYLNYTEISDIVLKSLSSVDSLQELQVYRTQVTEDGIRTFRTTHPRCWTYLKALPDGGS